MTSNSSTPSRVSGRHLTAWSLVALALGLGLGIALHGSSTPIATTLVNLLTPIGELWLAVIRVTVLPLVVTQMVVAVLGSGGPGTIGLLGVKAILLFVVLLVLAACFALVVAPPIIGLYQVDPATIASLRAGTFVPGIARAAQASIAPAGGSAEDLLFGVIPLGKLLAGSGNELLPLLLGSVLFAILVIYLVPARRAAILAAFRRLADLALTLVSWVLVVTPLAVLALSFVLVLHAGWSAAGFMSAFVVIVSAVLLGFTGLLYPLTALFGKTSIRQFARAVAPAQVVAASSRSSLASLPALVEGGRDVLALPVTATGFTLPFSVSVFKVNRTISAPVKLLFLSYAFGTQVSAGQMVSFVVVVILLSFTTLGVPSGGTAFRTLPAYLAAGVPIEGVVILEAVDAIPDIFKTITNVTGDLSAATLLAGRGRAAG